MKRFQGKEIFPHRGRTPAECLRDLTQHKFRDEADEWWANLEAEERRLVLLEGKAAYTLVFGFKEVGHENWCRRRVLQFSFLEERRGQWWTSIDFTVPSTIQLSLCRRPDSLVLPLLTVRKYILPLGNFQLTDQDGDSLPRESSIVARQLELSILLALAEDALPRPHRLSDHPEIVSALWDITRTDSARSWNAVNRVLRNSSFQGLLRRGDPGSGRRLLGALRLFRSSILVLVELPETRSADIGKRLVVDVKYDSPMRVQRRWGERIGTNPLTVVPRIAFGGNASAYHVQMNPPTDVMVVDSRLIYSYIETSSRRNTDQQANTSIWRERQILTRLRGRIREVFDGVRSFQYQRGYAYHDLLRVKRGLGQIGGLLRQVDGPLEGIRDKVAKLHVQVDDLESTFGDRWQGPTDPNWRVRCAGVEQDIDAEREALRTLVGPRWWTRQMCRWYGWGVVERRNRYRRAQALDSSTELTKAALENDAVRWWGHIEGPAEPVSPQVRCSHAAMPSLAQQREVYAEFSLYPQWATVARFWIVGIGMVAFQAFYAVGLLESRSLQGSFHKDPEIFVILAVAVAGLGGGITLYPHEHLFTGLVMRPWRYVLALQFTLTFLLLVTSFSIQGLVQPNDSVTWATDLMWAELGLDVIAVAFLSLISLRVWTAETTGGHWKWHWTGIPSRRWKYRFHYAVGDSALAERLDRSGHRVEPTRPDQRRERNLLDFVRYGLVARYLGDLSQRELINRGIPPGSRHEHEQEY